MTDRRTDRRRDGQTDGQTDAREKTICLPTLKGGDIIILKTSFTPVIIMYVLFLLVEKVETNIHLMQPFYLLSKVLKV